MNLQKLNKKILFGLFLTTIVLSISLLPYVAAADPDPCKDTEFTETLAEDTKLIYELRSFDKDLADKYLGNDDSEDLLDDGAKVGAMFAIMVDDVDKKDDIISLDDGEECDGWEITYYIWDWEKDAEDLEDKDDATKNVQTVFKNPKDLGEDINNTQAKDKLDDTYFVPTPSKTYISCIDFDKDADVEVSSSIVFIEQEVDDDVVYVYDFKTNGMLRSLKVLTDKDEIIYEISVKTTIGALDWTIVLGFIVGILTVVAALLITLYRIKTEGR